MVSPARKLSLHEEILKQMIQGIKDGEFPSGGKLPREIDLAKTFQVSRNCVREAMKTLGWLGIIKSVSGHGTYVDKDAKNKIMKTELIKQLTEKSSFMELIETRIFIEPSIAFFAAERATESDIKELKAIIEKSNRIFNESDEIEVSSSREFHDKLAEIAGNTIMIKILSSIRSEIDAQRTTYKDIPKPIWKGMLDGHKKILKHIEDRAPEKAFDAMYDDLLQSFVVLNLPIIKTRYKTSLKLKNKNSPLSSLIEQNC